MFMLCGTINYAEHGLGEVNNGITSLSIVLSHDSIL